MAENKKSFLLYCDLIHTVEKMPIEKAGELFMHILKYVNDTNPITNDLIIQLTFEPIKQALKRDLDKWGLSKTSLIGGYDSFWIRKKKSKNSSSYYIHRVVALVFCERPNNEKYVIHLDFLTREVINAMGGRL